MTPFADDMSARGFFHFIGNFDEIPYEIKKPSGQDRIAAENPTK